MANLLAEFELDEHGKPKCVEKDNLKHFMVRLFLDGAPADASSVQYVLHPTYIEPVRLVPKGVKDFEEYTTSYGDYEIRGNIRSRQNTEVFNKSLTDALKERYSGESTPAILEAIDYLKQR